MQAQKPLVTTSGFFNLIAYGGDNWCLSMGVQDNLCPYNNQKNQITQLVNPTLLQN